MEIESQKVLQIICFLEDTANTLEEWAKESRGHFGRGLDHLQVYVDRAADCRRHAAHLTAEMNKK